MYRFSRSQLDRAGVSGERRISDAVAEADRARSGSSSCVGIRIGRCPASSDRSASRVERLADLTELNVARASTSVPPAVASDEIVTQSAIPAILAGLVRVRPGSAEGRPALLRVGR